MNVNFELTHVLIAFFAFIISFGIACYSLGKILEKKQDKTTSDNAHSALYDRINAMRDDFEETISTIRTDVNDVNNNITALTQNIIHLTESVKELRCQEK